MFLVAGIIFLLGLVNSEPFMPTIKLRPKPKARAGGADAKAAAIFSFAFVSEVGIRNSSDIFSLSIGVLMDDIWVMDSECGNCKITNIQYNTTLSDLTSTGRKASYKNVALNIDAVGTYYEDVLTIQDYPSIYAPFVVCQKFVDVLGMAIDGIIGLGHNKSSIVYKLYENGEIDQPIYSLSFLNEPFLIIGTPNFLDLNLVVETQQTIKYQDKFVVTRFEFGEHADNDPLEAEFSSFSSYITGPFEILERIYKILSSLGCHYEEEILMCECEGGDYPELLFTIQDEVFSISSSEYLITLGDNCFLGMKSGERWILGEPFFKKYFFEMNLETQDITLYKTSALESSLPSPFETTEGWATMIGLGIGSIALYLIAFMVFLKYESTKLSEIQNNSDYKRKPRIL